MDCTSASVRPVADMTKFRKLAASTISMIMAVERMVPSIASRSMVQVRRRNQAARISAPSTPSAAASVGVARPA
ncbi:Uncharacterised protein [Bordetella pertussis]|nr:Uncharacterised protein [Bordetella pertussis]